MTQNAILIRANDELRTKVYLASQRADQLATRLGFSDIRQAEGAATESPELFSIGTINGLRGRIRELEASARARQDLELLLSKAQTDTLETVRRMREENDRLEAELDGYRIEAKRLKDALVEKCAQSAHIIKAPEDIVLSGGVDKENRCDDMSSFLSTVSRA